MKGITHVFFDLDHTLWDYERNASETLVDMMREFGISEQVEEQKFLKAYNSVNEKLWHKYNHGQIDKEHIRKYRFPQVLRKLKVYIDRQPEDLHDYFVSNCSAKSGLMPHALMALNHLKGRYPMAIITNGFEDSQHRKIHASGITHFFGEVVTSETLGYRKPQPEIFHHAVKAMGGKPETSVMIGDNPKTDIRGAEDAGLKAIFYNPTGGRKSVTEWEVQCLSELVGIL